jgi:predicted  nucleic acid-binding Zn-ribbon protein
MDSTRLSELQEMSMPDLWQTAIRLGISRKGKRAELINRILEAQKEQDIFERLRRKMAEFEKTREELRTLIESVAKLGSELGERKADLEESIRQDQEKIAKILDLKPKLDREKETLHEDVLQLEAEISDLDEQIEHISHATEFLLKV